MKNLNLGLVTAMITFSMVSLTSTEERKKYLKDRQYLSFDNAMKCGELKLALYQQVQPDFARNHQYAYLAAVVIEEIQYVILGTYEQWKMFFSVKWNYLLEGRPLVISAN